ncbi:MAG TPA: hypothetical protein VGM07_07985 [Stellaceae bacterium]|jgi:hypothetical protein
MNGDFLRRVFRTPPGNYLIEEFLAHIRSTGQPETFPGLHRGPIAKTEPFSLLKRFEIDRRKRPDGDLAPCPMCQPNKYLRGSLVYLSDLRAVAAIGHCCADKENLAIADREYRERIARDLEDDYLIAHIPLISAYLSVVARVRPAAREAERIYRSFRNAGASFQRPLRLLKKVGGLLALDEQLQVPADIAGPAGFRSRARIINQKIEFGFLRGMIALSSDYDPVRELDRIITAVRLYNHGETDNALLDYVTGLDPQSRRVATIKLREAGIGYSKFQNRIADFCNFFTPANIGLLNKWASHPVNPYRFEAYLNDSRCTFRRHGEYWSILLDPILYACESPWPTPRKD